MLIASPNGSAHLAQRNPCSEMKLAAFGVDIIAPRAIYTSLPGNCAQNDGSILMSSLTPMEPKSGQRGDRFRGCLIERTKLGARMARLSDASKADLSADQLVLRRQHVTSLAGRFLVRRFQPSQRQIIRSRAICLSSCGNFVRTNSCGNRSTSSICRPAFRRIILTAARGEFRPACPPPSMASRPKLTRLYGI